MVPSTEGPQDLQQDGGGVERGKEGWGGRGYTQAVGLVTRARAPTPTHPDKCSHVTTRTNTCTHRAHSDTHANTQRHVHTQTSLPLLPSPVPRAPPLFYPHARPHSSSPSFRDSPSRVSRGTATCPEASTLPQLRRSPLGHKAHPVLSVPCGPPRKSQGRDQNEQGTRKGRCFTLTTAGCCPIYRTGRGAQRGQAVCPRMHSQYVPQLGLNRFSLH